MTLERPRLALLRARTGGAHASIEQVPALARLMAPDLTPAEYVGVLRHMHGFLAGLEPMLAGILESCPAAAAMLDGERSRALADDLSWFGVEAIVMPPPLPTVETVAAALGALYVVEGSNLGGRVIARHVAASLGVRPGAGGSFYGGRSAEAARARWAALCDLLQVPPSAFGLQADLEHRADPIRFDLSMADGACATFQCLEQWMQKIDVAENDRPLGRAAAS